MKKSILIISDSTIFGGAEKNLYLLLKFLDKTKFNLTLACTDSKGTEILLDKIKDLKVKIVRFPAARYREFDIRTTYELIKIIYNIEPDIVYVNFVHHYDCKPVMFSIFPFFRKFAVIAAEQLVPNEDEVNIFKRKLNHLWIYIIDKYITIFIMVSNKNKETFINKFHIKNKKIKVIKNSIEIKRFKKNNIFRKEMNFKKEDRIIVTIARLTSQKGHIYLIKAIKKLVKKYRDLKFIFVGEGEIEFILKKIIKEYFLDNKIFFLGFREDIDNILNSSDIFILPSLYEGLPLSILEAMEHSLPVIATNVDGNAEVIQDKYNGYLVKKKSVNGLYNSISKLLDNYDIESQYLGCNAFLTLKKDFNIKKNIKIFEELFLSLNS